MADPRAAKSWAEEVEEQHERTGWKGPPQEEFREVVNRKSKNKNKGRGGPARGPDPMNNQPSRFSHPGIAPAPRFSQPGMSSSVVRFPPPSNGPNFAQPVAPQRSPHPGMAGSSSQFYQRPTAPPRFPPGPSWGAPPPPHFSRPLMHQNVAQTLPPAPAPAPAAPPQHQPSIIGTLLPSEKQKELVSSSHVTNSVAVPASIPSPEVSESDGDDDDDSIADSSGSDWVEDEERYSSDASVKSLETMKKSKLWKDFFTILDGLPLEEVNNQERQWHCPVCKGGVGAIDWYKGLQALAAHAKTMRTRRTKQHQKFKAILEAELEERGTSSGVQGATYGMWSGLREDNVVSNAMIVWPPMVMIQNTRLELGDDDKWVGMGNKELVEIFKEHKPTKAKHSYGPDGHRGISILVFESNPTGYLNAQSLVQAFAKDRRSKKDWESKSRILFRPGGMRVLYGYYATPEDLNDFNKHTSAKQALKWELQNLKDKVFDQLQKMAEDSKTASHLMVKVAIEKKQNKALAKTVSAVAKKLSMREEEVRIVQKRSKDMKRLDNLEMEDMENHFQAERDDLIKELADKEDLINKLRESYEQACAERSHYLEQELSGKHMITNADREEQAEIEREINNSKKDFAEFESKKEELRKLHHERMKEFKQKQYDEELEFVKALKDDEARLLEEYKKRWEM